MPPSVSVTIVTHNSGRYIASCIRSVLAQTFRCCEVIVVDNASTDRTLDILGRFDGQIRLLRNNHNSGFAAAQNQAIAASSGEWILTLNPDVALTPGFVEQLVAGGQVRERVGTVCGRLLAAGLDLEPLNNPLIDSAGIYFTPAMRHFDRGWHQPDDGRFRRLEYVFGASGAAALYRREMIDDISENGEFFDPGFFAYREDADVAWRAQLLGWRCLYVPGAEGYHVRTVTPGTRRTVPSVLNMHSVKNRFLMRIKNASSGLYRRFWFPASVRDLLVLGGCLLWEQGSLPAFWRIARRLPRALEQRRWIMARRRISDEAMSRWFSPEPSVQAVRDAPVADQA